MSSSVPAYIQEASRKGEIYVPVLIVRFNPETQTHTSIEKQIRTRQAVQIFTTPMEKRKQYERLVRPIDFAFGATPKTDSRKALSSLSDEDLLKMVEERGLSAKGKAKAKKEVAEPEPFVPDTSINEIFPESPVKLDEL